MQLTLDIEKDFIDKLQETFGTSNIKEALNDLLDFYKTSTLLESNLKLEHIQLDEQDYQLIKDAKTRRQNGEKTYSLDSILNEY